AACSIVVRLSILKSAPFRTYGRGRGDVFGSENIHDHESIVVWSGGCNRCRSCGTPPPAQAQGNIEAEMIGFHQLCDRGDKRACIRFGILIGENRQRHADWRRLHPDWWWWERP
ncbi:MAG: hypothetical protein WB756_13965, partial [Xanthobacteraceae bacterium]